MIARIAAVALSAALFAASHAEAHARLVSSDPAQGATVAAPKQIVLKFSEKLQPKFSGLTLTMPQMSNMPVTVQVDVEKDGVTMTATPKGTLAAGVYTVSWHAVAADTHRMEGKFDFTVR